MKYSTARWLTLISAAISVILISTYFYLDSNNMMIPFLAIIIKPVMLILLFSCSTILLANIIASRTESEKISRNHLLNAIVLVISLLTFKVLLSFLN